jgi:hypothetical protein
VAAGQFVIILKIGSLIFLLFVYNFFLQRLLQFLFFFDISDLGYNKLTQSDFLGITQH